MNTEDISGCRAEELRAAVRRKYREVSRVPEEQFPYPVGRVSLDRLKYEPDWLRSIAPEIIERYVGVGNRRAKELERLAIA